MIVAAEWLLFGDTLDTVPYLVGTPTNFPRRYRVNELRERERERCDRDEEKQERGLSVSARGIDHRIDRTAEYR